MKPRSRSSVLATSPLTVSLPSYSLFRCVCVGNRRQQLLTGKLALDKTLAVICAANDDLVGAGGRLSETRKVYYKHTLMSLPKVLILLQIPVGLTCF